MNAGKSHEEIHALAAAYALGVLDEAEASVFGDHLATGCEDCLAEVGSLEVVATQLASDVPLIKPSPELRKRLMSLVRDPEQNETFEDPQVQIWKNWASTPDSSRWIVRGDDAAWQQTSYTGVYARNLYVDQVNHLVTMMIKMVPGSKYPSHQHAHAEQCYVVEGDIHIGDQVYRSGDYLRNAAGSVEQEITTDAGCLLFIISSQHDRLLT